MAKRLRIGVLGTARIAPTALIRPARELPGVEVHAVASRDPARARRFARRHGVPRVHESYTALLADPEIDAIYNPLPNALHAEWTLRALEAGKPVLCEKPLAANAEEALELLAASEKSGLALMEAFHWRYHPLTGRMQGVLLSGRLGRVVRLEVDLCIPLFRPGDIRYRLDLAGGATMDLGCYGVSILRHLTGAEPEVLSARTRQIRPGVDRFVRGEFRFPDGRQARLTASLLAFTPPRLRLRVYGSEGVMRVTNPIAPHLFHRLEVRTESGRTRETEPGRSTYVHQLAAFASLVQDGVPVPTDARDGVRNMRVIDAIYRAAGLPVRGAGAVARRD